MYYDGHVETFSDSLAAFNHSYNNNRTVYRIDVEQETQSISLYDNFGDGLNGLGIKITNIAEDTIYCLIQMNSISNSSNDATAKFEVNGTSIDDSLPGLIGPDGNLAFSGTLQLPIGQYKLILIDVNGNNSPNEFGGEHYLKFYYSVDGVQTQVNTTYTYRVSDQP